MRFLVRRVLTALLLAVGITLVTFVLTNLVPGDPVSANLGQRALGDPAIVAQWRTEHGLDKPLPEQYLLHLEESSTATSGRASRATARSSTTWRSSCRPRSNSPARRS
ncbi:hypothetical protein ACFQX6_05020 [Streptosporangium lutulentum]